MSPLETALIYILIYSIVPTSGCEVITDEGTCFSHFTDNRNWNDARDACLAWGGDLATVTSEEENALLHSYSGSTWCWIGLNDINVQHIFEWVDGSDSTFRKWSSGEPNNHHGGIEDCAHIWGTQAWNDYICANPLTCYFCGTTG